MPCATFTEHPQETLQFTYHIQTAFVLRICRFHTRVTPPPRCLTVWGLSKSSAKSFFLVHLIILLLLVYKYIYFLFFKLTSYLMMSDLLWLWESLRFGSDALFAEKKKSCRSGFNV